MFTASTSKSDAVFPGLPARRRRRRAASVENASPVKIWASGATPMSSFTRRFRRQWRLRGIPCFSPSEAEAYRRCLCRRNQTGKNFSLWYKVEAPIPYEMDSHCRSSIRIACSSCQVKLGLSGAAPGKSRGSCHAGIQNGDAHAFSVVAGFIEHSAPDHTVATVAHHGHEFKAGKPEMQRSYLRHFPDFLQLSVSHSGRKTVDQGCVGIPDP